MIMEGLIMNWNKIICWFVGHNYPIPSLEELIFTSEVNCKRCGHTKQLILPENIIPHKVFEAVSGVKPLSVT